MDEKDNLTFLGGIGAGMAVMFLADPARGKRRRHRIRDKAVSAAHRLGDGVGTTARDIRNRTSGIAAEAGSLIRDDDATDSVIEARVRSALGRVCSHPRAVEVEVDNGRVILSGKILEAEVDDVLDAAQDSEGVESVAHDLEVFETAGDEPSLQGGRTREGSRFELFQENWTPAARLLTSVAGGALAFYGARRKDAFGAAAAVAGAGMLTRAATNVETKRLLGVGARRRAIDIQKTINVAIPVESVFQFWSNYENFPRFMSHVREVQNLADGRSRWKVDGPAGASVEWISEETARLPNEILAWKTSPGSVVGHAGIVHFEPTRDGGTRIHLKMSYNPPGGAIGHALISLLGANPKQQMTDDLARMKTMLETGIPPHDAAAPSSEELEDTAATLADMPETAAARPLSGDTVRAEPATDSIDVVP